MDHTRSRNSGIIKSNMPETIKTAVSLRRDLFERGEALARKMHLSRSRLFALALEEFVQNHENRQLLDRLNTAYADSPDAAERMILDGMRQQHRRILKTGK